MFEEIKYFIQRGRRGYSDRDLWSFTDYLCDIIPPALRDLAKNSMGCPGELWDKKAKNNECHKWDEILEEIAQGFEAAKEMDNSSGCKYEKRLKDGCITYENDMKKIKLLTKKLDRGLDLFKKYFLNLWD